jgi:hypothetical protein
VKLRETETEKNQRAGRGRRARPRIFGAVEKQKMADHQLVQRMEECFLPPPPPAPSTTVVVAQRQRPRGRRWCVVVLLACFMLAAYFGLTGYLVLQNSNLSLAENVLVRNMQWSAYLSFAAAAVVFVSGALACLFSSRGA